MATPDFMGQENTLYHGPGMDEYWKYFDVKYCKLI